MVRINDDPGPRWDNCLSGAVKNIATGTVLGFLLSAFVFKRKRWALLLGIGFGIGMAYATCDYEINQKLLLPPCEKKKKTMTQNKKFPCRDCGT